MARLAIYIAKKCHSRKMAQQVEEPEDTLHLNGNHAVIIDTPKVGELVNSLMVAMRENERWHTIIEGCNRVMME